MSLEDRVAYWVDVGLRPYQEVYALQTRLADLRETGSIPDVILAVQHPLEVNFGSAVPYNKFSDVLLEKVRLAKGSVDHVRVVEYLAEQNILFSETSRGGGATVLAPGQYVFYPIVDHQKITGKSFDMADYKSRIYRILFESLTALGVVDLQLGSDESYATRKERRDVWIQRDGKSLKMGSKGLRFKQKVAYHGFVLYVDDRGVEPFWLVNPCGYSPDEAVVTSVEKELGRNINPVDVYGHVRAAVQKNLGYNKIIDIPVEELYQGVIAHAVA